MPASFIHLHLHTEYSLVDGLIKINSLIEKVINLDMPAVAVTDMSNMFGIVKFYKAAISAGVKPIIGVDVWIHKCGEKPVRLILLCKNLSGYRKLSKLVSRSFTDGYNNTLPVIDYSWLAGNTEEIIAIILATNTEQYTLHWLDFWRNLFPENFYIGIQRIGIVNEETNISAAYELSANFGIPLVATNYVCFLSRSDYSIHEARVCIQTGTTLGDIKRKKNYSEQQYLRTIEEMSVLFSDIPEAIENSVEIARRCNLQLELGSNFFPEFSVPDGLTIDSYFIAKANRGLETRLATKVKLQHLPTAYHQRLSEEINIIIKMGFTSYFLIVADFVQWARQQKIPVGPGRGSGAGSLVAYVLRITDIDPLAYDLLFERFLNQARVSMPDFDIDFCMEGRDLVVDYVTQRYGRNKVAQIATHNSMTAKSVVRDVGRILGQPYGFVDRIAKLIPFELGITLSKSIEQEKELRHLYEIDKEVRALLDLALKLEGLTRSVGKHAGGVVIAPSDITNFVPLYCESGDTNPVTQFDKDDIETIGLVKFDFLGLRTLTIIKWAIQTINNSEYGNHQLDIANIPLDDLNTFNCLKSGQTTAIFQLESGGMRDLIRRLQPDCFEDIVALVALFRPGPLQSGMVEEFISRKHGKTKIEYFHPALEAILKPTYGVILYQEQVMQIAQSLAGYTLGSADILRRAIGKKKVNEMAQQRANFVNGAITRGTSQQLAEYIFDLIEKFAGYGFNKSHSVAYALLSYQTAWLKTHYPAAFMAAVLSSEMEKTEKLVVLVDECKRLKIKLLIPDINHSEYGFTTQSVGYILYGLGAIKGMGESIIKAILEERKHAGYYRDLFDLCQRMGRKLNRRLLENLIRSGALDALDPDANRAVLMRQLQVAIQRSVQLHAISNGQQDLFGLTTTSSTDRSLTSFSWTEQERLQGEKETLGIYLTGHPFFQFTDDLTYLRLTSLCDFLNLRTNNSKDSKEYGFLVAGLVVNIRKHMTQRGTDICFVTLDDSSSHAEFRIFPELYEKSKEMIVINNCLFIKININQKQVNTERIFNLDNIHTEYAKCLIIRVHSTQCTEPILGRLAEILREYCSLNGTCLVKFEYITNTGYLQELTCGPTWRITPTNKLIKELKQIAIGKIHYSLFNGSDH